jgi:putative hemolysin
LDTEERRLLVNTLRLRDVTAHRAMIPRNSMVVGPVTATCEELLSLLADSAYSRLPIYSDNIDKIVGAVHIKDLLCAVHTNRTTNDRESASLEDCLRPVLHVPEFADVDEVMRLLQEQHQILAIVVDEYGGTAGMITLEDLVEEIVGEFDDEFDVAVPAIELTGNGRLRLRGDVPIEDVEEMLDVKLEADGVETIGGLVLSAAGRIPGSGEILDIQDISIRVDRVVGNRVAYVSTPITPDQQSRVDSFISNP